MTKNTQNPPKDNDLKKSEEILQLLVSSVKDYAIFALDPSGYILTWNAGAEKLKGYTSAEAIGTHFSRFYLQEDIDRNHPAEELKIAVREGKYEEEGWRLRKDGSKFWASVVITALVNQDGVLQGFAKVTRDLTERKLTEEALRQSEERLRLLIGSVKDYAIFMLDPEGNIASWNAGAEQLKGYRPSEIIGQHFSKFYMADDLAKGKPEFELIETKRLGRFEDEGWRLKKDGSKFWANVIITAVRDSAGKLIGFAKVTRDLSERKRAEANRAEEQRKIFELERAAENERVLDQIFSESPSFMTLISVPEYRYLKSNEQHFKLLQNWDLIGKTVKEVLPEIQAQGFIDLLDDVVRTGQPYIGKGVPITYLKRDGQLRNLFLDFVYQPLKNANGEVYAITAQGYDVTEAFLSKKAMESERIKLYNLLMQAPIPICTLEGPELRYTLSNPKYDELAGRKVMGHPIREVFSDQEAGAFIRILDQVYLSGEPYIGKEMLAPLVDADGTKRNRFLDFSYHPFRSPEGQTVGIFAVIVDVTEYVLARKKVEENSALLNAISEASPDWVFSKDRQSRLTFANPAVLNGIGRPKDEIIGHTDTEFLGEKLGRVIFENDQRIMNSGHGETVEEIVTVDGKPRIFVTNKVPYRGLNREVIGLLGIGRDVTELRDARRLLESSELRYRTLTDALPQLVWGCLPDGQADYLSKQWVEYTGISELSQLGLNWLEMVIHPDDRARTYEHWMGAIQGLHPYDIEYRIRRFDGEYRWFKTRGTPMRNDTGEIIYWFGTCTDVQDTREILFKLEQAVRTRDDFLSIASHELKTPLTSLKLQAQMRSRNLNKDDMNAFSKERLRKMIDADSRQLERITHLIDDMLDISRINAGKLAIQTERVDLCVLTKDVLERYKSQFEAASAAIAVEACESVVGMWDRFRIEQVIINLFTNALRYGKGQPIDVTVEHKENFAVLSVRDRGIGIAKENHVRIFERFERAISANEVSGLGLGLYIVKQIVTSHGGTIRVESELGHGATFIVELPLALKNITNEE